MPPAHSYMPAHIDRQQSCTRLTRLRGPTSADSEALTPTLVDNRRTTRSRQHMGVRAYSAATCERRVAPPVYPSAWALKRPGRKTQQRRPFGTAGDQGQATHGQVKKDEAGFQSLQHKSMLFPYPFRDSSHPFPTHESSSPLSPSSGTRGERRRPHLWSKDSGRSIGGLDKSGD